MKFKVGPERLGRLPKQPPDDDAVVGLIKQGIINLCKKYGYPPCPECEKRKGEKK